MPANASDRGCEAEHLRPGTRRTPAALLHAGCLLASTVVDFEAAGGVPFDNSLSVAWRNGGLLNRTLAALRPGDTLRFPRNKTFHTMGGIVAKGLADVTIDFSGRLVFSSDIDSWPKRSDGRVLEALTFDNFERVTFTSTSGEGLLDGQGPAWWGLPGIGYLQRQENRPRLFVVGKGRDILVENITFRDPAYWTFWAHGVDGLVVRYSSISARRGRRGRRGLAHPGRPRAAASLDASVGDDAHSLTELTAFNTDGFDVSGRNVHIHDCDVWTQDDTIAVKDDSQDMLFERITASGVGLTIGSIGASLVRNITFRDCRMPHTVKGIYMKFRGDGGTIQDVTYENIVIDAPSWWPIWIGPAQQSDSNDLCAAHPCSLCWPDAPFATCKAGASTFRNILLRNITINGPRGSPGVLLGHATARMENVTFEDVVVNNPALLDTDYHTCEGVGSGVATGTTRPVPACFEDQTTRSQKAGADATRRSRLRRMFIGQTL